MHSDNVLWRMVQKCSQRIRYSFWTRQPISCIFNGIYLDGLFCFARLSWWPLREVHNKLTKLHAALLPFISTLARLTTIIATRS